MGRLNETTRDKINKFIERQDFGATPMTFERIMPRQPEPVENARKPRSRNYNRKSYRKTGGRSRKKDLNDFNKSRQDEPVITANPVKQSTPTQETIVVAGHEIKTPDKDRVLQAIKSKLMQPGKLQLVVKPGCGYCNMQKAHLNGLVPDKNKEGNLIFREPDPTNQNDVEHAIPKGFGDKFVQYHYYFGNKEEISKNPLEHIPKNDKGQHINQQGEVVYDPASGFFDQKKFEDMLVEARATEEVMNLYGVEGFPTFLYDPKVCNPTQGRCFDSGLKGKNALVEFVKNRSTVDPNLVTSPVTIESSGNGRRSQESRKSAETASIVPEYSPKQPANPKEAQMAKLKQIINIVGEDEFRKVAELNKGAKSIDEVDQNMIKVFGREKFDKVVQVINNKKSGGE